MAALITVHGLLSFLPDVYGLLDPSGKTLWLLAQGTLYTHSVKSSFSCLSFGCTSTLFKVMYGFIATGALCFLIILATASETFST